MCRLIVSGRTWNKAATAVRGRAGRGRETGAENRAAGVRRGRRAVAGEGEAVAEDGREKPVGEREDGAAAGARGRSAVGGDHVACPGSPPVAGGAASSAW